MPKSTVKCHQKQNINNKRNVFLYMNENITHKYTNKRKYNIYERAKNNSKIYEKISSDALHFISFLLFIYDSI